MEPPRPERSASPLSQRVREAEKLAPHNGWGHRPSAPHKAPRSVLYKKRVCPLEQYRKDVKAHKYEHLTRDQKLEIFGSTVVPIPVPLAVGETEEMYEERFVQWLGKQKLSLEELQASSDDHLERFYRIKFANLNSYGKEAFDAQSRKRSRSADRSRSKSPRRKSYSRRDDEDAASETSRYSRRSRSRDRSSERTTRKREPQEKPKEKPHAPSSTRRCTFERPGDGASITDIVEAYISCGCRPCLVSGMGQMVDKLGKLEDPPEEKEECKKTGNHHVDLTGDSEPIKHRSSQTTAEAITELVLSEASLAEVHKEVESKMTGYEYAEITEDVVENQLISEYDAINNRVEQESHDYEIADRNAALAMAIVYLWRHDSSGLDELTSDARASDDAVQQRAIHRRCVQFSSVIARKKEAIAKIKQKLDATMQATTFEQERDRIEVLTRLGTELATTEAAFQAYRSQRMSAFASIAKTCEPLRGLIRILLTAD